MELKGCCMGVAKLLFLFHPPPFSWPQNSRETACNIQTENECEQGTYLSNYRYFKKLSLDCSDNVESCYYPITVMLVFNIGYFDYWEKKVPWWILSCGLKRKWEKLLYRRNQMCLWPQQLVLHHWISQVGFVKSRASQGLLGCSQDSVWNSFSGREWETETNLC